MIRDVIIRIPASAIKVVGEMDSAQSLTYFAAKAKEKIAQAVASRIVSLPLYGLRAGGRFPLICKSYLGFTTLCFGEISLAAHLLQRLLCQKQRE